ncbi:MAG TPA: MFS transporter [Thermomicrobiales bacterium]
MSAPSGRVTPSPTAASTPLDGDGEVGQVADHTSKAPPARFAALQSRNFRFLWIGLLISNAGTWMTSTAEGWLVTDLEPERSAFWLGIIAAAFAVPMLVLPPFGGVIADRLPRLTVLWTVQLAYLITTSALATLTLLDLINVWFLVAYGFCNGVILAFDSPVRHAILPDILSREQLTSGVSLNSIAFTGAALVGPAIAGSLIPIIGVSGVFTVDALSCVAILFSLAMLRNIPRRRHAPDEREGVVASIASGVRYVVRSPLLRGLLLVSLLTGLFARSYGPLLAVFAREEFQVSSTAFGLLVSAGGLGTLAGGFWVAARREMSEKGRWVIAATLAQVAFLAGFAASPWYGAALPLLILVGFAGAIASALIATLIQLAAPSELRGRVMSLFILTVVGFPSAGSLIAGLVADVAGVRIAVGGAAVFVLVLLGMLFIRDPHIRSAS